MKSLMNMDPQAYSVAPVIAGRTETPVSEEPALFPGPAPAAEQPGYPRIKQIRLFAVLAVLLIAVHGFAIASYGSARVDGTQYGMVDDDVMISMRYGRNLARGNGLVYNPGERVEGFTNPILTLYTALLHLTPAPDRLIPFIINGTNVVFSLIILGMLLQVWRDQAKGVLSGALAAGMYVLLAQHGYYAYAGYEVYMQAAALLAIVARIDRFGWREALLLGLLPLTHATMMVTWAALLVIAFWRSNLSLKAKLATGALAAAPMLVYEIFRVAYYGDALPNTYWLKVGSGSLKGGILYAGGWARLILPLLVLSIPAVMTSADKRVRIIAGIVGLQIGAAVAVGGDIFPLGRFLFPASVLMCALAGKGVMTLYLGARNQSASARVFSRVTIGICFLLLVITPALSDFRMGPEYASLKKWSIQRIALGNAIRSNTSPGTTIALFGLGFTGYYSDRPVIDMLGKADSHISRTKPNPNRRLAHNKSDFVYVMKRAPQYVELNVEPQRLLDTDDLRESSIRDTHGYHAELSLNQIFRRNYASNPVRDGYGRFCKLYGDKRQSQLPWKISEAFFR